MAGHGASAPAPAAYPGDARAAPAGTALDPGVGGLQEAEDEHFPRVALDLIDRLDRLSTALMSVLSRQNTK